MGVIDRFIGMGSTASAVSSAASNLAEVFTQNATRRMELDEEAYARAITQFGVEFTTQRAGIFDSFVNGLNRLPRPVMTLGTLGLFIYAMVEPAGFGLRMEGLALVPEPLWWLFGAVISFYFGAREAHHFRQVVRLRPQAKDKGSQTVALPDQPREDAFSDNAALRDWAVS